MADTLSRSLEPLLAAREVVVFCGSGGVGKTSVAAASAVAAATRIGGKVLVLTIDPARLSGAEVRVEPVGDDTYPHVYGPLNRSAVVDVVPLDRSGGAETLMSLWLKGMAARMGIALAVMGLVAVVLLLAL